MSYLHWSDATYSIMHFAHIIKRLKLCDTADTVKIMQSSMILIEGYIPHDA